MTLNIGDVSGDLRRLGMSCRMYLALKMSDSSGDLIVSIVRIISLIVGGNGSGELRVSDEPSYPGNLNRWPRMLSIRISVAEGSGHVCLGKSNRPSLPSGGRRRM